MVILCSSLLLLVRVIDHDCSFFTLPPTQATLDILHEFEAKRVLPDLRSFRWTCLGVVLFTVLVDKFAVLASCERCCHGFDSLVCLRQNLQVEHCFIVFLIPAFCCAILLLAGMGLSVDSEKVVLLVEKLPFPCSSSCSCNAAPLLHPPSSCTYWIAR